MKSRTSRLRILVIAEACNPAWTSVPLVGYNFACALAAQNELDVTIATHPRNRRDIEGDVISKLAKFVYPDNEYVASRLFNIAMLLRGNRGKGWTTNTAFSALSYLFFEYELYRLVRDQLRAGKFDLIHRITPVSPTVGSPICTWTDVPMIIGPMNGGLPWPREYPELRGAENEFLVPLRKAYKWFPYYRRTFERVRAAIAGSRHTLTEIPKGFLGRRCLMPENGVDPRRFEIAEEWTPPSHRFRFVTVGRLVPYKGLWLTLHAMRDSRELRNCELFVIGDGPDRDRIKRMVKDFNLTEQVTLLGWMDQVEIGKTLASCQCFVFPSLREFGGGVVLEAMASGLPSIVVDYGGPCDLIDSNCGILLPMQDRATMVPALRTAMEELAVDHEKCRTLARNAIARVRKEFTWAAKAKEMRSLYEEIIGKKACPPEINEALDTLASTF